MEVPSPSGNQQLESRVTYRSVKPPDQCVISYNFEHANSLNFTHNLLIGMGLNEPSKKQNTNNASPNKQKLFSIIPQPKKVFRNEPNSVNKAYHPTPLPKRYVPERAKPHNSSVHSQNINNDGRSISNDINLNEKQRENDQNHEKYRRVQLDREVSQGNNLTLMESNSPYGTLDKKKTDKSRLNKSQNIKYQQHSSISHQTDPSAPKIKDKIRQNHPLSNSFIKEQSNEKESQLSDGGTAERAQLQRQHQPRNANHPKTKNQTSKNVQNNSNLQQQENQLVQKDLDDDEEEHSSNLSIDPAQQFANNPSNHPQSNTKKHQIKQKNFQEGLIGNNNAQGKIKSKKQIQDEQLQQLQARVRKQEAAKFKKGYFRTGTNKEKEILPFQATIEPLFSNTKSPAQHIANTHSKTSLNATENRGSIAFPSTHADKRTHELTEKTKGSINNLTKANSTINLKTINSESSNKFNQKDIIKRQSNFVSATQSKAQIKEKQNKKGNISVNHHQSNYITAVPETQKIKRTEDASKSKVFRGETADKYKSIKNDANEDLTANNQIKGFKIPQKSSVRMPKLSKNSTTQLQTHTKLDQNKGQNLKNNVNDAKTSSQSASNLNSINQPKSSAKQAKNNANIKDREDKHQTKQVKKNNQRYSELGSKENTSSKDNKSNQNNNQKKSNNLNAPGNSSRRANMSAFVGNQLNASPNSNKNQRSSRLKPTQSRQAADKDRKFKKWKDSQLQQAQRQKRESKRREKEHASTSKQRSNTKRQSRLKSRPSKEIDLDAEEEDKFGLLSKKKSNFKNNKKGKNLKQKKSKGTSLFGPQQHQEIQQEDRNISQEQSGSDNQEQESADQSSNEHESEYSNKQYDLKHHQEDLMDENLQRISSIHSSKISEKEEEITDRKADNRQSILQGQQNLEELLKATEQSPSPNKMDIIPVDIELEDSATPQKHVEQHKEEFQKGEKVLKQQANQRNEQIKQKDKLAQGEKIPQDCPQRKNAMIESQISENNLAETQLPQVCPIISNEQPKQVQKIEQKLNTAVLDIQQNNEAAKLIEEGNISNKQEDFFEYNIKEMSKFNETVNQTFNITKYETFQKDLAQYQRAPILSFIYGQSPQQANSFIPSNSKTNLLDEASMVESISDKIIDQAINILLSIDPWIVQRIFQPFLSTNGSIGVWLYWQGHWTVIQVEGQNYRTAIKKAVVAISSKHEINADLQNVLRLISGVRIAKLKSSKKRVLSQLDYSLNKKHVLKAVTSKQSKWGERMFEVVKVQTSKQGGNVLKLKERSQFIWVRQQKFQEIFQHFLLICTRPSHFWTTTHITSKESHKSVLKIGSDGVVHGSVTLFYPSKERSSLCLYKQLDSKVLKFMGKIQQKANQNGNLYFQFRMHGTYYLFLQTPTDCDLSIESTSKLAIDDPEYIISQTLKNDKCEYVEIEPVKGKKPESRQLETLEKLREKFIKLVTIK